MTFNKRKTVALLLVVTIIMMPVTGTIIHASHRTVAEHKWLHIHVIFGVLFVIVGIFHIIYNWKALKRYLLGK